MIDKSKILRMGIVLKAGYHHQQNKKSRPIELNSSRRMMKKKKKTYDKPILQISTAKQRDN